MNFTIPEKLLMITIDDAIGVIMASERSTLPYGLVGAMLAELALAEAIRLEEGRLVLTGNVPSGEPMLTEILEKIAADENPHKLKRWIEKLGNKRLIRQVAARLEERGVIRVEQIHYLWVIPFDMYPQVDASAKHWVKQHLRDIVLSGKRAEPTDIALLSLLKATRLLRLLFTRDERIFAYKKVSGLVKGEAFGKAVEEILEEIDAATAVAFVTMSAS